MGNGKQRWTLKAMTRIENNKEREGERERDTKWQRQGREEWTGMIKSR